MRLQRKTYFRQKVVQKKKENKIEGLSSPSPFKILYFPCSPSVFDRHHLIFISFIYIYIFLNVWRSIIANVCLPTLQLSAEKQVFRWCLTHIILIKNLFSEEYSSLRALWGDRLMTVTSIISSQALVTYNTWVKMTDKDNEQSKYWRCGSEGR